MDLEPLKEAFWKIIADCLQHFHGYSAMAARVAVRDLRERIEHGELRAANTASELFYHNEPFAVACSMAGRDLPFAEHRDEYWKITRQRYEPAERVALSVESQVAVRASG